MRTAKYVCCDWGEAPGGADMEQDTGGIMKKLQSYDWNLLYCTLDRFGWNLLIILIIKIKTWLNVVFGSEGFQTMVGSALSLRDT